MLVAVCVALGSQGSRIGVLDLARLGYMQMDRRTSGGMASTRHGRRSALAEPRCARCRGWRPLHAAHGCGDQPARGGGLRSRSAPHARSRRRLRGCYGCGRVVGPRNFQCFRCAAAAFCSLRFSDLAAVGGGGVGELFAVSHTVNHRDRCTRRSRVPLRVARRAHFSRPARGRANARSCRDCSGLDPTWAPCSATMRCALNAHEERPMNHLHPFSPNTWQATILSSSTSILQKPASH